MHGLGKILLSLLYSTVCLDSRLNCYNITLILCEIGPNSTTLDRSVHRTNMGRVAPDPPPMGICSRTESLDRDAASSERK